LINWGGSLLAAPVACMGLSKDVIEICLNFSIIEIIQSSHNMLQGQSGFFAIRKIFITIE
jgi:hypothetical protein